MSEYIPEHRAEDNEEPVLGGPPPKANVLLSNRVYDWFKRCSLYILPALAAAYFGLAQIWGLPKAEEVVGSVAVIETLLGVIIRVSNGQYENSPERFDGLINVSPDEEAGVTNLDVSLDPQAVATKNEIVVKVNKQ